MSRTFSNSSARNSRGYSTILFLAMAAGMMAGAGSPTSPRPLRQSQKPGPRGCDRMCAGGALILLGIATEEVGWIVTWLALALACVAASEGPIWTAAVELGGPHGGTAAAICNTGGTSASSRPS